MLFCDLMVRIAVGIHPTLPTPRVKAALRLHYAATVGKQAHPLGQCPRALPWSRLIQRERVSGKPWEGGAPALPATKGKDERLQCPARLYGIPPESGQRITARLKTIFEHGATVSVFVFRPVSVFLPGGLVLQVGEGEKSMCRDRPCLAGLVPRPPRNDVS
jgi:hypothetical protein